MDCQNGTKKSLGLLQKIVIVQSGLWEIEERHVNYDRDQIFYIWLSEI